MKRLCASAVIGASAFASAALAGPVIPSALSVSPDGELIAITWAGDLWVVERAGGVAVRVTSHPADEGRSAFSPDGKTLAFESNRDGAQNLYVVDLMGEAPAITAGAVRRVTEVDRTQALGGFSADGASLVFSAFMEPSVHRHARMYAAPIAGGPTERITDAFGMHPKAASDGGHVFVRGRDMSNRPRYRGSGSMDLYRVSADGGFERLTRDAGSDYAGHPVPDGSVVFTSGRDGQNNVYRLAAGADDQTPGALTQLTSFDVGNEASIGHGVRHLAVSADGTTAAFVVWDTLYTLDLTRAGAAPIAIAVRASADDDVAEHTVIDVSSEASEVAWHPSGEAVAVVARGEIWVRSTADDRPTRRVTETPWRERDIAWSPDGERLYFSADDEESLGSIHAATVTLTREDLAGAAAEEDEAEEAGEEEAGAAAAGEESADESGAGSGDAPEGEEPDGEDGDSEDGDAEGGDDAEPEENTHGARWAGALAFAVEPVVAGAAWDRAPVPAPDGSSVLITRGLGDLVLVDLASGEERVVFEGWDPPDARWLSDSRHIVYSREDLDHNSDVWLLDLEAGGVEDAVNLTRHPDYDYAPRVSADGKVLVFLSDRAGTNWEFDVHRVYLDRALEEMTAYELAEHFEEAKKAASKRSPLAVGGSDADVETEGDEASDESADDDALTLDVDDAWLRIRRVTSLPGSEGEIEITPGGDRIVFAGEVDSDEGLFSVKYDGSERKRVAPGSVSGVGVSLTGSAVSFVKSGRVSTGAPGGGDAESYPITARVRVETRAEQRQKFLEGARTFGATFYDLKGLDWARLTERYLTLAETARTSREFNAFFAMLLGEVDGSHTGIRGGGGFSTTGPRTGYLGVDLEPAPGGYRVTRVLEQGPSAKAGEGGLLEGDVIVAVNSDPVIEGGAVRDIRAALTGTSGAETLVEVERGGERAFVLITPHSYGRETTLRYEDEIRARRAEVERLSEGRLGYLHIRGMNLPSVRVFERDLYAAANGREGLIIDVRDNGGGFTTDILLASLTAPRHAYTTPRGADRSAVYPDTYPRDRRLIYGWTRPINVIMNQYSFSNAEIFSHAIKTTGRGRLIGTTTFGGVISTGGFSLIDGTFVRRPFRGWYLPDGRDMDVHGAEPDVPVSQTPSDEASGRDRQLEAAVRDLLNQIDMGQDPRAVSP